MRTSRLAPLAAALLLAACGGSTEEQTSAAGGADEAGGVSNEAVASRAESMVQPRPGEYRTTVELLEFYMPGMSDAVQQQMRSAMGASLTQSRDFCLTPEEAEANGPQNMAKNLAQSNCTMDKFHVSGNTIAADMSCKGSDGAGAGKMRMEGQMSAEGSVMTMAMDQEMPGAGTMHMKMKVTSERTGDCS